MSAAKTTTMQSQPSIGARTRLATPDYTLVSLQVYTGVMVLLAAFAMIAYLVLAVQFNPFENVAAFSNDTSLLLPEEFLGTDYLVMSWPTSPNPSVIPGLSIEPQLGYFTVIATAPGTSQITVTVTGFVQPSQTTADKIGLPMMVPGDTQVFFLERGQVLHVESMKANAGFSDFAKLDLTGSSVRSDKPVAVFGGHEEAVVTWSGAGENSCCAEHFEEQLFPVATWGDEVLCAKSKPRGGGADVWRILSGADGNQIGTDPPQQGAQSLTLDRGEWRQVEATGSVVVKGTGPVSVGQFTVGGMATPTGQGDPDFVLMVPTNQYRTDYPIAVPEGFTTNIVTIVRPAGAAVALDGAPVSDSVFTANVPNTTWQIGYLDLTPGVHLIQAGQPIGLYAYGWANAVSYGYPAGLDLKVEE